MSRICVKGLPKQLDDDRLREFFSQKGDVTDAKLMRTKDGKSRQFAFVGYRTEAEAEEAMNYFNNSYLGACKIVCEIARKVGDPNLPRPWSRHTANKESIVPVENNSKKAVTKGSRADANRLDSSVEVLKNGRRREEADPKLQEFLQVMQPREKSKMWANDAIESTQLDQDETASKKEIQLPKNKKKLAQVNIKSSSKDVSVSDDESHDTSPTIRQNQSSERNGPHKDDALTDAEYMRGRVKANWSDSDTDDDNPETDDKSSSSELSEKDSGDVEVGSQGQLESESGNADAEENSSEHFDHENDEIDGQTLDENKQDLDSTRLFVRNLPYTASEDDMLALFSQFGDVSQVHLVVDKDTKRSKGIGYVLYSFPESANKALQELDNSIFQGRLLHIMPAKPQSLNSDKLQPGLTSAEEKRNFKQLREEQRKASEASGNTQAWNSLFMRQDTIIENIARKHGISKSDFLEREADDLAVRIALGETHVISETKKSLSVAGINVEALEKYASKKTDGIKRSNHVILVKNLPYSSTEGDLANMFGKFGSLDRIVMPRTKALALVIFLEAAEARAAFKGLAYKRYKDAPLYLEWAPGDILSADRVPMAKDEGNAVEENIRKVVLEQTLEEIAEEEIDPDRTESRSVFVKNLNFQTSDESLRKHFNDNMKSGTIKSVKVQKQLKKGKNLSMGFGFIEFDSMETAVAVCKDLQGTVLEGHALILQLCRSKKSGEVKKKDDQNKSLTKLMVRNIAFEATEKDLKQLFSPFGQIRSLRLPMKIGGHRGFAFVEYVTKQEAQSALQALANTHLYGRHLVIERAKKEETLEELRERTAAQFVDELSGFQKLSKKRKQLAAMDEGSIKFSKIVE